MDKPTYQIETDLDGFQYNFESVSNNKIIKKSIRFYPFQSDPNVYELVFGDILPDGSIDVKIESKNKDMILIINTVIKTVSYFLDQNPDKSIAFMGSSSSRNRLYRAVIAKLFDEKKDLFDILGWNYDGSIEPFTINKDYLAFEIKLKYGKEK
jgi:hypothetical protein